MCRATSAPHTISFPRTPGTGTGNRDSPALALVFEDVEAGVVVRDVDQSLLIHEDIAGLNLPRALGARIVHLRWRWRYVEGRLPWLEWVADIEGAHAGVLIRGKNQL